MVNIIEIHEKCKNSEQLIDYLRKVGLILNDGELKCPKCENGMKLFFLGFNVNGG